MVPQVTEAVFTDGVLKPDAALNLRESQRVRLIIVPLDEPSLDRQAAVKRLVAGLDSMRFFSTGPLPSRDELHDRV